MLKEFKADLHLHSCLSPCAEKSMMPDVIVNQAKVRELDIIGICDHNSAENVGAVIQAGKKYGITVLPGMEACSREEIHLLALFDSEKNVEGFQKVIYGNLQGVNDDEKFGIQVITDINGEIAGTSDKLLIGATGFSIDELVDIIHGYNGLAIASHVDREEFSILGQLGFIPKGLLLDAVEISPKISVTKAKTEIPGIVGFPLVTFSDAHTPDDIGKVFTVFLIEKPVITEIKNALLNKNGREIRGL